MTGALPVESVSVGDTGDLEIDRRAWPWHIPAVQELLDGGRITLSRLTVLVGENGSGKSTLVEAIGESFLELLSTRFDDSGLYVLDEPESALSFSGCLALVGLLHRMASSEHRQAIVATHSPIIAATPGATVLEVGAWGLREVAWEDLELVQNWRDFLGDPDVFLRHVL